MVTQIKPWGNSQGIRIPKELLEQAGISLEDDLELKCIDGNIIISKKFRHRTLKERAVAYGGQLGPYEEFDYGEPVGREWRLE